jgi:hypothetical protein
MSTTPPSPTTLLTSYTHVELANLTVRFDDVDPALRAFAGNAGLVYYHLFGKPLIITSGLDSQHAPGSKHYTGKAIDVRSHDLDPGEQVIFTGILAYMSPEKGIGVFDERGLSSGPHWHIELLG